MTDKEQILKRIELVLAFTRGDHKSKVDLMSLKTQALFIATHLNKPNHMPLDSPLRNEKIRHYVLTGEIT